MHNNSVIELSQKALEENIEFLRTELGTKVILSSVVKGNAYGHGIKEFVSVAHNYGITHFSAFDAEEAKIIRKTLEDKATVMIMGFIADEDIEWAVSNDVEFFVFDKSRLQKAIAAARKLGKPAKVHIEAETGMNRTGFDTEGLKAVAKVLESESDNIIFSGLCTHYAGAESITNYDRVKNQINAFNEVREFFKTEGLKPMLCHTACSAASMMFPETRMDMVRIGIMQYGLWPSPEVLLNYLNSKIIKSDPLRRLISWKSEVMSMKTIAADEYIGYGTSFKTEKSMKVAIIPIGYSHGYSRSLSNHGRVLINGKQCAVVGTVNMNMITVDISDAGKVNKGDEVVLIGTQNDVSITIASFSDLSNQMNYELLTRIAKTIPRKITE